MMLRRNAQSRNKAAFSRLRRCSLPLMLFSGAVMYAGVLAAVHRVGREAARLRDVGDYGHGAIATSAVLSAAAKKKRGRGAPRNNCLNSSGAVPVILLSRGRSGTGSMWQILGSLSGGKETPSDEYTGANRLKSEAFFHNVGPDDGGRWVLDVMCHYQRKYKRARVVGFKWKPFRGASSFFSSASRHGLELIAALAENGGDDGAARTVKVVRSRRNPLDVLISQTKHGSYEKSAVAPHCVKGDDECVRKQLEAGKGVRLPDDVVATLREASKLEDDVDHELRSMRVPFIDTTFEKTHGKEAAEEWMRIFRFLGVGPKEGLTAQELEVATQHVSTSHKRHNETIANYDEVRKALAGTEFEKFLH